jgi:hypothetical protein
MSIAAGGRAAITAMGTQHIDDPVHAARPRYRPRGEASSSDRVADAVS